MLEFIYGTAGTGKTTLLTQQIGQVIASGGRAILLVPEQYSFESERRIYREFGPSSSLSVEVLSFTRLCNSVFRKFGGLAGSTVTPTAQYLLMSVAVSELADQLQTYKKSVQNISFLETLLQACSEFKTAGITPVVLEEFVSQREEGRLKAKLGDLSLVYSAYQALLETGYTDPEDDLIRACGILENNSFFGEFSVFVDGFTTFMAGEFELLGHVIAQSKKTTFALTTDQLVDTQGGTGVFSVVQQAAGRLTNLAKEAGVPVAEPIQRTTPHRYLLPELAYLSTNFLQPAPTIYERPADGIGVFAARDSYQEIEWVASEIRRLVREEEYRFREIAVVARSPKSYLRMMELVFGRYEIPFFADKSVDIESSPLVFGLLAALAAVQGNFEEESMLFLAKSPIMGLPVELVAQLENYCYSWAVKGQLWQSDFVNHPRGLVETFSEGDLRLLGELNQLRSQLITPLLRLKEGVEGRNGYQFAVGVYGFLEEISAAEHLKTYAQGMNPAAKEEFLSTGSQLWDHLMDVLDVFGQVLRETPFSKQRLIELFRLAVASLEIGLLPQTLDQVLVGGADRIRPSQVRAIFVVGANEGVFPAVVGTVGVFSDLERKTLLDAGLGLASGGLHQALLERYYGYYACTLPSEKLMVSWHRSNLKGGEELPSILVTQLEEQFPGHRFLQLEPLDLVERDAPAFGLLATEFDKDSPLRATLWEYFTEREHGGLERMAKAAWKPPHALENQQVTTQLFGREMRLSPSKVERFYRCPFAYFIQDGLRLKKRQKIEFSPLESGSLIHHVLQVALQNHGGKGLATRTQQQLEEEVSTIITEYLASRVEDLEVLPTRFHFLFRRLCGTLARLLTHLGKEFSQSLYEPAAFELAIAADGEVTPLTLFTPSGISVTVEGVVDRVDVMELGGERYIRVVDYKSGSKDFKLQDVLSGLNLQMLLYLFTIQEHGTEALAGGIPAGVLYMPVRESYMSLERNTNPKEAQKKLEKQWKMSGLLLDDPEVLKGMEQELEGIFIPAALGKSGELLAASAVASREELGRIAGEVKKQILDMATALSKGKIPAFPMDDKDYPTCTYCDYREACGYEEGDPTRQIDQLSQRQVLELLEEREKHNEQ